MVGAYYPGYMYAGMSGIVGGAYLTIDSTRHSNTADIVAITQKYLLVIDDSFHTQTARFTLYKVKPPAPSIVNNILVGRSSIASGSGYTSQVTATGLSSKDTIGLVVSNNKPEAITTSNKLTTKIINTKPNAYAKGTTAVDISALTDSLTVLTDDTVELTWYYTDGSTVPLGSTKYAIINAEVTSNKPMIK